MLINLIEHQARAALLKRIEEINTNRASAWGLAVMRRENFQSLTNDAFLLAVKPALADTGAAQIFVLENGDFYALWLGMQKQVYQTLHTLATGLLREGIKEEDASVFIDPQVRGNELMVFLRAHERKSAPDDAGKKSSATILPPAPIDEGEQMRPTGKQKEMFHTAQSQKSQRKQLHILVVEDQPFLRKMLKQILAEDYQVDTASGIREGWELYLSKAPDIVFLDIGLDDGNGHVLARSIKQFDPDAYVVMVTSYNQEEELRAALYNRVDGYVVKPYNRQQISGYIGKFMNARKLAAEARGHA